MDGAGTAVGAVTGIAEEDGITGGMAVARGTEAAHGIMAVVVAGMAAVVVGHGTVVVAAGGMAAVVEDGMAAAVEVEGFIIIESPSCACCCMTLMSFSSDARTRGCQYKQTGRGA